MVVLNDIILIRFTSKSGFYYNHCRQVPTKSNNFRIQILLESKQDDLDNCFIDFKIIEIDGGIALNKQSEKQNCQTHGVRNQLKFGHRWHKWEG